MGRKEVCTADWNLKRPQNVRIIAKYGGLVAYMTVSTHVKFEPPEGERQVKIIIENLAMYFLFAIGPSN